jgi:hypothetical protein
MRLFGFEITRCNKMDEVDSNTFKNLVMGICREVTEFRDDLDMFTETLNNLDTDPDINQSKRLTLNTINMINIHFNCIKNYISLYCDNKFADQFVSVSLLTSLQKLSEACEKLQGLISAHFGTISRVHDFMESDQFTSTDEDSQIDFMDKHDEFMGQSRVLIGNVIEMMNITILRKMYNVILYDIIEIDIGVDLIRSRLHRKSVKKICVNGKRVPDFQISIFNDLKRS